MAKGPITTACETLEELKRGFPACPDRGMVDAVSPISAASSVQHVSDSCCCLGIQGSTHLWALCLRRGGLRKGKIHMKRPSRLVSPHITMAKQAQC